MAKRPRDTHYNIAEAKASLSSIVREVLGGEDVVIAKDGKPLVRIVRLNNGRRAPGSARGQVTMASDFDAPLDDFCGYR